MDKQHNCYDKRLSYLFLLLWISVIALIFAACSDKVPYNSNSGTDGSRDTATQLVLSRPMTSQCNAEIGDNEDWYYFNITEAPGTASIRVFFDKADEVTADLIARDSFGRPLVTVKTKAGQAQYDFEPIKVENAKYFFNFACTKGKSAYTLEVNFTPPPPPEPVVEDPPVEEEPVKARRTRRSRKKPEPEPVTDDPTKFGEGVKTLTGDIVLATEAEGGLVRIKIRRIGKKYGVKSGAKAQVIGLNKRVKIYNCERRYCMGTVRTTVEDLERYRKVSVIVE